MGNFWALGTNTCLLYFRRNVTAASMVWNDNVALPAGRSIRSSYRNEVKFPYVPPYLSPHCSQITLTPPGTTFPRRCSSASGMLEARLPITSLDDLPPTTAGCAMEGEDGFADGLSEVDAPLIENPFDAVTESGMPLGLSDWCLFLSPVVSWDSLRLVWWPLGTIIIIGYSLGSTCSLHIPADPNPELTNSFSFIFDICIIYGWGLSSVKCISQHKFCEYISFSTHTWFRGRCGPCGFCISTGNRACFCCCCCGLLLKNGIPIELACWNAMACCHCCCCIIIISCWIWAFPANFGLMWIVLGKFIIPGGWAPWKPIIGKGGILSKKNSQKSIV